MSEALSPRDTRPDADAWAKACAEDMAEQASKRRVRQAYQPGSAADELRKLANAIADKVDELRNPLVGMPLQMLLSQAKSVLSQARNRNPALFDHLAAAGSELLAAYRSAVESQEKRWTNTTTARITVDRADLDTRDLTRGTPDDRRAEDRDGGNSGGSGGGKPGEQD